MNIVLLASSWGPKFGGINAFNQDFALGLASYVCPASVPERRVFCIVSECDSDDVEAAARLGVRLILAPVAEGSDALLLATAAANLANNPHLPPLRPDDVWVGHDDRTGWAAIAAAKASGSRSAVIMHMNFDAFKHLQDGDIEGSRRGDTQLTLVRDANCRFAVGPLLADYFGEMTGKHVHMLVPGLSHIDPLTARGNLECIVFGRLEQRNEIVKQGRLAAKSFGAAVGKMRESDIKELVPPACKLFGADTDDVDGLHQLADEAAGAVTQMKVFPFEHDRQKIFDALARANLAIVPSLYEGFALTGWEAIAAETPLILSRNTGLWKLLVRVWNYRLTETYVKVIDVRGRRGKIGEDHYLPEDVETVSEAIVEATRSRDERIFLAAELKRQLKSRLGGCSWEKTAEDFLVGLGVVEAREIADARFAGDWIGFFVEGSTVRAAQVVRERITVSRPKDADLSGVSNYDVGEESRREEFAAMQVLGGVLNGRTAATRGYTQDSWCQFQVAPRHDGRLMEGVVTWSSTVETLVDWSRYIWVEDKAGNEDLLFFAEREMLQERSAVQHRIDQRARTSRPAGGTVSDSQGLS